LLLVKRIAAAATALKVFPLPSAVLFPGALLPLHIFEPRYRVLVADCLGGDQVMALSQLVPGWEGQYEGRPPQRPICCAGLVTWHDRQPDGRYNLILQGVVRARILEELPPSKPYREVKVDLLPDPEAAVPEDGLLRNALLKTSARLPGPAAESLMKLAASRQGGPLADAVAAALVDDVEQRYSLLAELDASVRIRRVLSEVGDLMARLAPAKPEGPLN
jgi:Lon protease-like protein